MPVNYNEIIKQNCQRTQKTILWYLIEVIFKMPQDSSKLPTNTVIKHPNWNRAARCYRIIKETVNNKQAHGQKQGLPINKYGNKSRTENSAKELTVSHTDICPTYPGAYNHTGNSNGCRTHTHTHTHAYLRLLDSGGNCIYYNSRS